MKFKGIIIEKYDRIALVTINRPKELNVLNSEALKEIGMVVDEIEKDESIYVVIITGAGKAFVAGGDISEMKELNLVEGRKFSNLANKIFRKLENLNKPVIAAVNGFALGGGCELLLACDIRIASSKAKFGQPEVSLGITTAGGATKRLPMIVGVAMAKELIYTGKIINSDEAFKIGLINKIVQPEKLLEEANNIANDIINNLSS